MTSEDGSCDETTAKKVIYFEAITKKRSPVFLRGKIEVTPSVAAPGDTNPSDATGFFAFIMCMTTDN